MWIVERLVVLEIWIKWLPEGTQEKRVNHSLWATVFWGPRRLSNKSHCWLEWAKLGISPHTLPGCHRGPHAFQTVLAWQPPCNEPTALHSVSTSVCSGVLFLRTLLDWMFYRMFSLELLPLASLFSKSWILIGEECSSTCCGMLQACFQWHGWLTRLLIR